MRWTQQIADSVTVSERAARRIGEILKSEPAGTMLRVSVEGGGCSGFQYKFDMDRAKTDDDLVIARDGAVVLIDSVSVGLYGRFGDRLRRRPDRRLVQDQKPESDRRLRLRHQFFAVALPVIPGRLQSKRDPESDINSEFASGFRIAAP